MWLGREIDYVWRRKKSNSSYYFFLNRYFSFFGNLAVSVLGFTNLSTQVSGPPSAECSGNFNTWLTPSGVEVYNPEIRREIIMQN